MPSRATANTATIIDHIYYHEGCNSKKDLSILTENLWSDLTDHLPNYFLVTDKHLKIDAKRPKVRLFSAENILKFKTQLSNTNWDPVYNSGNVNDGYHYFERKLNASYNSSFNLVKLSHKRAKDKIWMTSDLKCSSRHKNILYRKWRLTGSTKDEQNYKKTTEDIVNK